MISYPGCLKEIARARICIDLPGNGPICHRQIDYLAVGACVIGPKPPVALPVELRDGEEIVYAKPDLSDLLERCEQVGRRRRARTDRRQRPRVLRPLSRSPPARCLLPEHDAQQVRLSDRDQPQR